MTKFVIICYNSPRKVNILLQSCFHLISNSSIKMLVFGAGTINTVTHRLQDQNLRSETMCKSENPYSWRRFVKPLNKAKSEIKEAAMESDRGAAVAHPVVGCYLSQVVKVGSIKNQGNKKSKS